MSHEIRTPINGIMGMAELTLGDDDLSEEHRGNIECVLMSAESLLQIVNDILDFSKVEAGKLIVSSVPFRPRVCVEDSCKLLMARVQQKNLSLVWSCADDIPESVMGDPGRLRQVILNLVGNAIKFTDSGSIRVSAEVKAFDVDSVCMSFSVTDTGIGIPKEKQRLIFDAFTQADGSSTREYGGTGLGLTISCKLIELMGGTMGVESEVGRGSRFWFDARFEFIPPIDSAPAEQEALPEPVCCA